MANTVEIEFRGRDSTGAAAASAINNTRRMSAEMKGLGNAFSQAGNLANQFGNNALASVIGQLDSTVMSAAMLTKELGKSKLAFAALAVGATAGGFAIGNSIRQYIPFFNEVDKLEAATAINRQASAVGLETLGIRNPAKAAMLSKTGSIQSQIDQLRKPKGLLANLTGNGDMTAAELNLVDQLERQKSEIKAKYEEENFERESEIGFKLDLQNQQRKIETLAFENEFAAKKMEVRRWESEQRRVIDETEMASEEQKNESKVTLARLSAAKIAEINAQQQKAEALKWKANARGFADYTGVVAGGLGQLAALTAQMGKKQFKLTQMLRYGEAVMSTASGIARAYADYAWPYSMIVAALVGASGAAQVATIASAKGPQAHGGVESVPQDQTVLLQQGERVIKRDQNKRLMEIIDGDGGGGGGAMINLTVFLDSLPIMKAIGQASRDGRLTISARAVA